MSYSVPTMSIQRLLLVRLGGIPASRGCAHNRPSNRLNAQKVTDHLWVIMNAASGNVAVLPTEETVLLVDDRPEILAKVKAIGNQPIQYIQNMHQHDDHTGGNAFMLKNTPAAIVIHKNARANM
jgi:cyclase